MWRPARSLLSDFFPSTEPAEMQSRQACACPCLPQREPALDSPPTSNPHGPGPTQPSGPFQVGRALGCGLQRARRWWALCSWMKIKLGSQAFCVLVHHGLWRCLTWMFLVSALEGAHSLVDTGLRGSGRTHQFALHTDNPSSSSSLCPWLETNRPTRDSTVLPSQNSPYLLGRCCPSR
jgi:hypothetical protein